MSETLELAKNFEEHLAILSPEEQYKVLSIILSSNDYLQWRVKTLLNSVDTPDFLTLLPPEIQHMILSFIDGTSLMKACAVSKKWNKLINGFSSLWKRKSGEISVNLREKPANIPWSKAFSTSLKQLHCLKSGKAFSEKYINLQDSNSTVKAIDYHDGYICTVSKNDLVNVWHLALNVPVLTFNVFNSVSCIKFRPYCTLVCGHLSGILSSWDLSDMNSYCLRHYGCKPFSAVSNEQDFAEFSYLKEKYKMHSGPVFTCDFSKEIELLISGGGDGAIKFWCLRSGEILHSICNQIQWILKVRLIPVVNSSMNRHTLIAMTKDSIAKYECALDRPENDIPLVDSDENYPTVLSYIENVASIKVQEHEDVFVVPGFQTNSDFIGIVLQDLQEKQSTFNLYDLDSFQCKISVPLNFKVRKFLALGDKFSIFLSTSNELYMSSLVVVDIFSGQIIGRHSIPHTKMTTPDSAQLVVGDTRWLDGLRGWEFYGKTEPLFNDQNSYGNFLYCEGSGDSEGKKACSVSSPNYLDIFKDRLTGKVRDSLVLATGLQLQEGTFFTLWWGIDKENKAKVD